ncbi:peptidoglycan D,D-transpeptidase FtsI family protein [Halalkalibacillus halophilus]|uniref:peptidoglycan D,D-transpeptidase FtsI family protein n=1 Tax=Halalkalibacillus halophilus TaxID=392827 RepID=UPI0004071342|nr:penicillin-binding protein 2 [Halalkalibacillus halophilus]
MAIKKQKSHLPLRLNLLFFAIFLLFSLLILQLGVVQILYGQDAQEEIDRTENVTSQTPVPRGRFFDRNGEMLVDNNATFAITYTPRKNVQPDDNLELAETLVNYIDIDPESVTQRNIEDYWIMQNTEEAASRLTDEELTGNDQEQYYSMLEHISEDDLNSITDEELEVIAVKRELDQAYELTPHIIKRDEISQEEYAIIAENLTRLPGINVTTDWERVDTQDGTFSNFIGRITSAEEGLPRQRLDYFLSRNYSRNDRVGRSGLEEQYENYLSGHKEVRRHETDSSGRVINSELIRQGERGKDLVLSVDIQLQKQLDQIVQEELENAINAYPQRNQHMDDAMAVMMDPNTGEILAMSGQTYNREDGEFIDNSNRVLSHAFMPGSTVKGATILAGIDSGVISPGEVINDRPINIAGTAEKSSYRNLGNVNDIEALKLSSNVYMFLTALRMGGEFDYQEGENVNVGASGYYDMVNYFKQFGFGVETGVDFPSESTGFRGSVEGREDIGGIMMDLAIGQHETYTTLQLAQYASTIANGGYRMEPRIVKQIHDPISAEGLGPVYEVREPKALNKIGMEDQYLDRVREGFRQAFQETNGTGYSEFDDAEYSPAGKTGTAQEYIYHDDGSRTDVENLSLVGYAPHDEPEVSFAIIVPKTGIVRDMNETQYSANLKIGRRALDAYFDLKEQRGEEAEELEEQEE